MQRPWNEKFGDQPAWNCIAALGFLAGVAFDFAAASGLIGVQLFRDNVTNMIFYLAAFSMIGALVGLVVDRQPAASSSG